MIHIAHLSDIHYGNRFDPAAWDAVAAAVIEFEPDLIVVSGDLVDDPSPTLLLAAKCALRDLSQRANEQSKRRANGRAAELVIVPGNHDVFESGVAFGLPRLDWFERIFECEDTSRAEATLASNLDCKLGFNATCQGLAARASTQRAGRVKRAIARLRAIASGRFMAPWRKKNDFTLHLGSPEPQPRVRTPEGSPILLALFDSNPTESGVFTATGLVDNEQLIRLAAKLASVDRPYLARIAIVHHHVVPIAFSPGQQKTTGEPMMVLRNAGAVLRVLADHKFDLILHGHWHKAQFTRIDFGTDDRDSYPIAIAAAGSAAMRSDSETTNCFNLITVADNGRIAVKSVFYGAGQSPSQHGEPGRHFRAYNEPIAAVKRRAYARARERHPIECDLREQMCEISENGDLWVRHGITGLRLHGEAQSYKRRPLAVFIPPHGHFVRRTLEPDATSARAGVRLEPAPDHPGSGGALEYYWINLPGEGLVRGGNPANYSIGHACANCMTMTRWEAAEKAKPAPGAVPVEGFDDEWVAARVTYPTRRLILSAKFPPSLAAVQPHVACYRHQQYPAYTVDRWGDADMPPESMRIDLELQEEERHELRYEASTRTWFLTVDRPMVGCQYALRWKTPSDEPHPQIAGDTREWQRMLLNLGRRVAEGNTCGDDGEAVKQFNLLLDTLKKEICRGGPEENWVIALFAYDSERLGLRPALSHRSWSPVRLPPDFRVPFGDGVSGAAFQQRRIVAWGREWAGLSLIEPVAHPRAGEDTQMDLVNILALPVYHPDMADKRRPPPWAVIGVVTIGSSSYGSPIAGLGASGADTQRQVLRSVAQAAQIQIGYIIAALRGGLPSIPRTGGR